MTKKLILFLGIIFLTLPSFVNAFSYSRTPTGTEITSPVEVEISFDSWEEMNELRECPEYSTTTNDWIIYTSHYPDEIPWYCGEIKTSLSGSEIFNLPTGEYWGIYVNWGRTGTLRGNGEETCWYVAGGCGAITIEENEPFSFEIIEAEAPVGRIFTLPTNLITSTMAFVGDLIDSIWVVIILAIAIPLGFYIIPELYKLFYTEEGWKRWKS